MFIKFSNFVPVIVLLSLSLSLCFNGHFPGEPGLAGVCRSKGWWRWWWQLDYWSYKSCKAPVKSSPPTNQHPVFTGRMPFLSPNQQCQSSALNGNITFHGLAYPKFTWGSSNFCLWPLIAPGYLGDGCHASHQPSDASTPSYSSAFLFILYVWMYYPFNVGMCSLPEQCLTVLITLHFTVIALHCFRTSLDSNHSVWRGFLFS